MAPPSVVSSGVGGESGHAPTLERQARLPFNAARTRVGEMASGCAAVVAAGEAEGAGDVDAAGAGVFVRWSLQELISAIATHCVRRLPSPPG